MPAHSGGRGPVMVAAEPSYLDVQAATASRARGVAICFRCSDLLPKSRKQIGRTKQILARTVVGWGRRAGGRAGGGCGR